MEQLWVVGALVVVSSLCVLLVGRYVVVRRRLRSYAALKERLLSVEMEEARLDRERAELRERDQLVRQRYEELRERTWQHLQESEQLRREAERYKEEFSRFRSNLERLAEEKAVGFPWLAEAYADYFALEFELKAQQLESKQQPARRAAEQVRVLKGARREAELKARLNGYIVSYYESLFPWLEDFRADGVDPSGFEPAAVSPPARDPVRDWISDDDWARLSSAAKADRALENYLARKKSNWEIGRDFERHVGYWLEQLGYEVTYQGIAHGFADLGRDLVARSANGTLIVQCKYWARTKQIHEKHVFQLYGTSIAYELDHPGETVTALFVTSTRLSERARAFAGHLNVQVHEEVVMRRYPLIKCNIGRQTGERIYHLPFDQQYDTTVIENQRGECYAWSAAEAEERGFRRAFIWRGGAST